MKYQNFFDETLQGKHGKTPEIFLKYTRLVECYLILDYSIRIGNLDLFLYVLPKITNVFFAMNHHNYARYMTIYYDKLVNIESTHPGLYRECKETFLGLRRTSKPFSRIPQDLTLEQTVNADAASRANGVINLTNSFHARERWAITHSLVSSITSKMMDFCGLKPQDEVTNDLKPARIINLRRKLDILLRLFKENTNPFSAALLPEHLYQLYKGQSVDNEVYVCLSGVEENGNSQRISFISECCAEDRFDKAITKNKIINFDAKNNRKVRINDKVQEIRIQRDVFGHLLYASLKKKSI